MIDILLMEWIFRDRVCDEKMFLVNQQKKNDDYLGSELEPVRPDRTG